ncbi:hypothetical protein FH972_025927 [Carpinus fangiana]|uniref:Myb-like domain-containing protein n=1 Tax=Carpinus fangiana TaxID=176857 RepID=A0A5N6L2J4_9ROSI|nr:hypothetical protein FH972_025927 [Carpinus fangiana]
MSLARKNLRLTAAGDAPDIEALRLEHDKVFIGRLDGILQKYDRDFEGIADEIDMNTGEIVVNNGHISRARDSYDIGRPVRRPAPYIPVEVDRQARRQQPPPGLLREVHNVVHHHYAPELHATMTESRQQPDLASSMLQILARIERMEARNESFHAKIASQLGIASLQHAQSAGAGAAHSNPSASRHALQHRQSAVALNNLEASSNTQTLIATPHNRPNITHPNEQLPSSQVVSRITPQYSVMRDRESPLTLDNPRRRINKSKDIWAPVYESSPELPEDGGLEMGTPLPLTRPASSERRRALPIDPYDTADQKYGWTREEDVFLLELVQKEAKTAADPKSSRWQHISAAFIERFPDKSAKSIKSHFCRIVPGGIGGIRAIMANSGGGDVSDRSEETTDDESHGDARMTNEPAGEREDADSVLRRQRQEHEWQQEARRKVRESRAREARKRRQLDKQDRRMKVDPPGKYSRPSSLPEEPSKDVRRSARDKSTMTMREIIDRYEEHFRELDVESESEVTDAGVVADAESDDQSSVVSSSTEEEEEPNEITRAAQPRLHLKGVHSDQVEAEASHKDAHFSALIDQGNTADRTAWTPEEMELLVKLSLDFGTPGLRIRDTLKDYFPTRSFRSVQTKLRRMRTQGHPLVVDQEFAQAEEHMSPPLSPRQKRKRATEGVEGDAEAQAYPSPVSTNSAAKHAPPLDDLITAGPAQSFSVPDSQESQVACLVSTIDTPKAAPPSHNIADQSIDAISNVDEPGIDKLMLDMAEAADLSSTHNADEGPQEALVAPPPRKRGRPSKADIEARRIWAAAQSQKAPALKPAGVSFAVKPKEQTRTKEPHAADEVAQPKSALKKPHHLPPVESIRHTDSSERQLPASKPPRPSPQVVKQTTIDRLAVRGVPAATSARVKMLGTPVRNTYSTPQMAPRPKMTPTAMSAPPLRGIRIDDLSEDELA